MTGPVVPASHDLGDTVRDYRRRARLKQTDVATAWGVSQRTVSEVEAGRRPLYTQQEVARLAGILGVPPARLRRPTGRQPDPGLTVRQMLAALTDDQVRDVLDAARQELRERNG